MKHLSEPAKSTRFSLAYLKLDVESFSHRLSITHVKTLCERLLSLFIFVAATLLFAEPYMKAHNSNKIKVNATIYFSYIKRQYV